MSLAENGERLCISTIPNLLRGLSNMQNFNLRKATIDDLQDLFHCRNDKLTRKSSHNQAEVLLENHRAWLENVLKNPMRDLFVLEHNQIPVGTSRMDHEENGTSEISWSIYPDHRGKKFAKHLINLTLQGAKSSLIRAEIKSENQASIKAALSCGMSKVNSLNNIEHYLYIKKLSDIKSLSYALHSVCRNLQEQK